MARNVIVGLDPDGNPVEIQVDEEGALIVSGIDEMLELLEQILTELRRM